MNPRWILSIDEGTTGVTVVLLDHRAHVVRKCYSEISQYYPRPGWVEHDAEEIWRVTRRLIRRAVKDPREIAAIGITNQRETVVVWNRRTGRPIHRAIVWQCRRTAPLCDQLRRDGIEPAVKRATGLVLDAYFSATKIRWLLDHVPGARSAARRGDLLCGTMDTWLIWQLTGGASHVTDPTNASRTMLYHIDRREWDGGLLKMFGVPRSVLPQVVESTGSFGVASLPELAGVPIRGVAGDQQAALFGQGCFTRGAMKTTYGTGCFLLMNTGVKRIHSRNGLLTTLACGPQGEPVYALEGSVFIAGAAVQWLRDGLKIVSKASETESMARSLSSTGGVYCVPAFTGLGAPHWRMDVRGALVGLTRGTGRKEIVRAVLESIAYQTRDVVRAIEQDAKLRVRALKVDGGAAANNFLMQFQADILGAQLLRPKNIESTSLGAGLLAGLGSGFWSGASELGRLLQEDRVFSPRMGRREREALYAGWQRAVRAVLSVSGSPPGV